MPLRPRLCNSSTAVITVLRMRIKKQSRSTPSPPKCPQRSPIVAKPDTPPIQSNIHTTMRFSLSTVFAVAAAAASTLPSALAASCSSKGGCQTCASRGSLESAKQTLCGSSDFMLPGGFGFQTPDGASINLQGNFATSDECSAGFENILQDCYGKKNGGTFDFTDGPFTAHLDINFCTCCAF
ncbi:hypothetical protein BD414DRAFT_328557 [Trametes punicea]|nr:hypothetical protein BD414DRAFT_328557 [Trametes punicea]